MRKLTKAERLGENSLPEKNARRQVRKPKTNGEGVLRLDPRYDYAPEYYKPNLDVAAFIGHSAREAFSDVALASDEKRRPNGRAARAEFERLWRDVNNCHVEFLMLDLDLALTMAQIATEAESGSERRERNTGNARRAYDNVSRLLEKVDTSVAERHLLARKLTLLHMALTELGEPFQSFPFAE